MRKFGEKEPSEKRRKVAAVDRDGEASWLKRNWLPVSLFLIVMLTIIVRTVSAYSVSAGNNFALTGEAASEHKHTILNILAGTFGISDPSLNYPLGGELLNPPLVDIILAGFAFIVTLFGVDPSTAAAGVLAFSGPIAAAITTLLIYVLGKEMFDRTIGIISALFFATLPLPVVMSVFSEGSGMSIVLMFFVLAAIFALRGIRALRKSEFTGIKTAFSKDVLKYTIIAGVMFGLIGLSWNGFSMMIVLLVFMMAAHAVILRLNDVDFSPSFGAYATMLILAIAIPLPYYVAVGLFTQIFTGPLLLSIIGIVSVLIFYVVQRRPKLQSFLIPIIAVIAIFAALYLAIPDLFNDVVSGNAIYSSSLIASLMESGNISISRMASFYGWATVWMPFVIITYMMYRLRSKDNSDSYLMSVLLILGVFILSWLSYGNAIMAGTVYSIAAAATLVKLYRYVDMTEYFKSIRGGGWKASLKKFLKPEPFISLVMVLLLVVVPNAALLADASTSYNSDRDSSRLLGGLGYTVDTDEINPMNSFWDQYYDEDKEGALATWFEYSSKAADRGGFTSVTSDSGQGASAVSNILLAKGSSGALAAMALRMIMSDGIDRYSDGWDLSFIEELKAIVENSSETKKNVLDDSSAYPGINQGITEENAVYLAGIEYITDNKTDAEIWELYDGIRNEKDDGAIGYIGLNAEMLPLFYGDSSSFAALAYLNDYSMKYYQYGVAASKYYDFGYSGIEYTDAMYESFLWKALFGLGKDEVGQNLANSLMLSDGTVVATPARGLGGFTVDSWQVKYNSDSDAGVNDSGWKYMDGYAAVELQKKEGGLINYYSSMVMLKVADSDSYETKPGEITYGEEKSFEGVKVAVFEKDENGTFVQRFTTFTDADGKYSVLVPTGGIDYEIRVYTATDSTIGSIFIGTLDSTGVLDVPISSIHGTVSDFVAGMTISAEGMYHGVIVEGLTTAEFTITDLPSDKYVVTLKHNGKVVSTQTVMIHPGDNFGVDFVPSVELTVNVKDIYGAPSDGTVVLQHPNGNLFEELAVDGVATFNVLPNDDKYIVYVNDKISTSASVEVDDKSVSADVTVYEIESLGLGEGITVFAPGYSSSGPMLPKVGNTTFTILDGDKVQVVYDGAIVDEMNLVEYNATLKSKSDKPISGTVTFFGADGLTLTYAAGDDGILSAKLPVGEEGTREYTAYAVGDDGSCAIKKIIVSATPEDDEVFKTDDGRKLTVSLTFASGADGTKGLPFRQVSVKIGDYTIFGTTGTDGKSIIIIPSNEEATVSVAGGAEGAVSWTPFEESVTAGTSSVSKTFNVPISKDAESEITVPDETWLWDYGTTNSLRYHFEEDKTQQVTPGKYKCVVKVGETYTYSEVKVFIGQTKLIVDSGTEVGSLILVTIDEGEAKVTVETDPNNEGDTHYKVNMESENDVNYLLKSGASYQFKAVKDDQIAYVTFDGSVLDPTTFTFKDKVTLKGYVGVDGDGTARITIGERILFTDVKDGEYEIDVPLIPGTANIYFEVTAKPSGAIGECKYVGNAEVKILDEHIGGIVITNTQITGDGNLISDADKPALTVHDVESSDNGEFKFKLDIDPVVDVGKKTYAIKAVGPWKLDKYYTVTLEGIASITDLEIVGTFDPDKIGDGNPEMRVSLVDLEGTTVTTGEIGSGYVSSDHSNNKVIVTIAGEEGARPDVKTDNEYLYAITIRNQANYLMEAKITLVSGFVLPDGWIYTISDENGRLINDGDFPVAGYSDTVLYVKMMNVSNYIGTEKIPELKVKVNITSEGGAHEIEGQIGEITLSPKELSLDTSLSVGGNNIYNEGNAMQPAFWVLTLLSVISIVLIVWLGSKRGVFTRRK